MSASCFKPNPLQHGGTTQQGRPLAALAPDSVSIDGREIDDLICFSGRYAELLAYYNERNEHDGTWGGLVRSDLSFAIADAAKRTWAPIRETFDEYVEVLRIDLTADNLKALYDIVVSVFLEIEGIYRQAPAATPFTDELRNEIKGRLRTELERLIGFYEGGIATGHVDGTHITDSAGDAFRFVPATGVIDGQMSSVWIGDPAVTDWSAWVGAIAPDATIYVGSSAADRINNALFHVASIYGRAYEAYVRIVTSASSHLGFSLSEYPSHQPHVGLLLSFLKLFKAPQADLNRLTERHLEHYLRDILQLEARPATPDTAHVIVNLAKHVPRHLVAAGTEFKAGKDDLGEARFYVADEDLVATTARVAELRTLFVHGDTTVGGVFDAPVAASADGLGEVDLNPDNPVWRPFGQPQSGLATPTMQRSRIGWAIASPLLRLAEGVREIRLSFIGEPGSALDGLTGVSGNWFELTLSGAEGWVALPASASVDTVEGRPSLCITAVLNEEIEAIVDYDSDALDGGLTTGWPVARLRLSRDESLAQNVHARLRDVRFVDARIHVDVKGIKNLVLQNDFGPLDPSKAFAPFGPRPQLGSNFYVGNYEALTKPLASLTVGVEWMGLPSISFADHYTGYELGISNNIDFIADVSFLKDGEWTVKSGTHPLFTDDAVVLGSFPGYVSYSLPGATTGAETQLKWISLGTDAPAKLNRFHFDLSGDLANKPDLPGFKAFEIDARQGFMRFELSNPVDAFGHDVYPGLYTEAVIQKSNPWIAEGDKPDLPNEPYTPTLRSIKLDYVAEATLSVGIGGASTGQFFHLHPFGFREVDDTRPSLIPPFLHEVGGGGVSGVSGTPAPFEGALYVGIEEAEPGSVLSLLLQVAEGTEDSSKNAPDAVVWSYLSRNRWRSLDVSIVGDSTRGLLAPGIVRVKVPDDLVDDNTLLPGGLRWLRVSISNGYEALPQMVDVRAQALRAVFSDRGNDPAHLTTVLPAGQIAKLVRPVSAIKKIEQPFESFGGRPREAAKPFYTRTSERLRHKQRAITIWDYERLVLERFPALYKVKCLNHTRLHPEAEATELAPGHVAVVVIPDFRNRVAGDKFKPRVSNSVRDEIDEFLSGLNCPFANVSVTNPAYEAVNVSCEVRFHESLDDNLYRDQLSADIDRFLAPWVFEQGRYLDFGGALHRSVVLKYIEDLGYVDFVTDLTLSVRDNAGTLIASGLSEVTASTSWSVLTSHRLHHIGHDVCLAAGSP